MLHDAKHAPCPALAADLLASVDILRDIPIRKFVIQRINQKLSFHSFQRPSLEDLRFPVGEQANDLLLRPYRRLIHRSHFPSRYIQKGKAPQPPGLSP